jgi:cytochrome c biogenesis protein CcdA
VGAGGGLSVLKLPTSFPYFAVIAAIVGSGEGAPTQIALLTLFNIAFVVPLLVIWGMSRIASEQAEHRLVSLRDRLHRSAAVLIPVVVLVVALALVVLGALGLASA